MRMDRPGDVLSLVVRAREIGCGQDVAVHDDRLRPGGSGLSQSGIEAELTSASIVQRWANNDGCAHFKQY